MARSSVRSGDATAEVFLGLVHGDHTSHLRPKVKNWKRPAFEGAGPFHHGGPAALCGDISPIREDRRFSRRHTCGSQGQCPHESALPLRRAAVRIARIRRIQFRW